MVQYKKKNLMATLQTSMRDGERIYFVTTQSAVKEFKNLTSAETYLIKKGYVRI